MDSLKGSVEYSFPKLDKFIQDFPYELLIQKKIIEKPLVSSGQHDCIKSLLAS